MNLQLSTIDATWHATPRHTTFAQAITTATLDSPLEPSPPAGAHLPRDEAEALSSPPVPEKLAAKRVCCPPARPIVVIVVSERCPSTLHRCRSSSLTPALDRRSCPGHSAESGADSDGAGLNADGRNAAGLDAGDGHAATVYSRSDAGGANSQGSNAAAVNRDGAAGAIRAQGRNAAKSAPGRGDGKSGSERNPAATHCTAAGWPH